MAAQHQQRQRVVVVRYGVGGIDGLQPRDGFLAAPAGAVAAPVVDQPSGGHGQQPGPRLFGDALPRPLHDGGGERLLHGVLARVELSVSAGEHAEDLRCVLAQQVLDAGGRHGQAGTDSCMACRISMGCSV